MPESDSLAPCILQIRDTVANRECSLRLEPEDLGSSLSRLMEKYVKQAPMQRLLAESRMTESSADALFAIQDLLYASDDTGRLRDMYAGVSFTDAGRYTSPEDTPSVHRVQAAGQEVFLLDVGIDRIACQYDRNWTGFHARKWSRAPQRYSGFIRDAIRADHGEAEADEILELGSAGHRLTFLRSLARRVWRSPFENFSRFTGRKLVYKSGDETIDNILEGGGAVCSEKVQALKFLTDRFGFESEYLLAGPDAAGPVPVGRLREILTTFDPRFAKRHMRYWQHTALLYEVDGRRVLVDATNGNVPFLFLSDAEADGLLRWGDKQPVRVRMVEAEEDFYYHRVPQDVPENLFFALEGWLPFSDLMQVFDNELGLYLSADFYVAPVSYRSQREYQRASDEFAEVARKGQLQCSVSDDWTLDTPLGREFAEAEPEVSPRILEARDHLLQRLDQCDGPGHDAGLVVMKLARSD